MSTDIFELHIQQSLAKLEELWLRSKAIPTPDSELWSNTNELPRQQQQLLQDSLSELANAIEELRVASETVRQQNEELFASRQEIVAEKEYYQQLFDSAPDCYIVTSQNGTIAEVNQKAVELLGTSAEYLKRKSLAVFVKLNCRSQFYAKLNQIKRGEITQATFPLEISPRDTDSLTVECQVKAMYDRTGKLINLSWHMSAVKTKNLAADLTPILLDSLRYPLYNLVTEIEEIRTDNISQELLGDRRWYGINNNAIDLKHIINNAYIYHRLNNTKDLNLSLVDYNSFIRQLVAKIKRRSRVNQELSLKSDATFAGICDVMLLEQIIVTVFDKTWELIDSEIEISLTKDLAKNLIIKIKPVVDRPFPELFTSLKCLIEQNSQLANSEDLSLAAMHSSLNLLNGTIKLESENGGVDILIKLPLLSRSNY